MKWHWVGKRRNLPERKKKAKRKKKTKRCRLSSAEESNPGSPLTYNYFRYVRLQGHHSHQTMGDKTKNKSTQLKKSIFFTAFALLLMQEEPSPPQPTPRYRYNHDRRAKNSSILHNPTPPYRQRRTSSHNPQCRYSNRYARGQRGHIQGTPPLPVWIRRRRLTNARS